MGTKNAFLGTENKTLGSMEDLKEDIFAQIVGAGLVRSVSLEVRDGHASIVYRLIEGGTGSVHTKRGEVKQYRIETALRLLRSLGITSVAVDMSTWSVGQLGFGV